MPLVLVSLGSNLGDRRASIRTALDALAEHARSGLRVSSLHETAPVGGPPGQGGFVNAAAAMESDDDPHELLALLQRLERDGRRDRAERWSARTLDLDLLAVGDHVVETRDLRLPHPRLSFRPFVLAPAVEVAPDWRHPELGATLADLWRTVRLGRDAVAITADGGRAPEFAALVRAMGFAGEVEVRSVGALATNAARRGAARLWIDARTSVGAIPEMLPSPRLRLADTPRGEWAAEVRAALECVWPTTP
ncbi:MAG: 2-amino-4-hydroxy-6-hydroxymethyldihydropteridine diphosphokinase [Lacipirellulaceae bacterium]